MWRTGHLLLLVSAMVGCATAMTGLYKPCLWTNATAEELNYPQSRLTTKTGLTEAECKEECDEDVACKTINVYNDGRCAMYSLSVEDATHFAAVIHRPDGIVKATVCERGELCICSLKGDPHLKQFDGEHLNVQREGRFTFAKTNSRLFWATMCEFNVEVTIERPYENKPEFYRVTSMMVTVYNGIYTNFNGLRIRMDRLPDGTIVAYQEEQDHTWAAINFNFLGHNFVAIINNGVHEIRPLGNCGMVFSMDGYNPSSVTVTVHDDVYGGDDIMEGLCGDCNDNKSNDPKVTDFDQFEL